MKRKKKTEMMAITAREVPPADASLIPEILIFLGRDVVWLISGHPT